MRKFCSVLTVTMNSAVKIWGLRGIKTLLDLAVSNDIIPFRLFSQCSRYQYLRSQRTSPRLCFQGTPLVQGGYVKIRGECVVVPVRGYRQRQYTPWIVCRWVRGNSQVHDTCGV